MVVEAQLHGRGTVGGDDTTAKTLRVVGWRAVTARIAALLALLALALPPAALGQGDPFSPVPPPARSPTPQPAPQPDVAAEDDDVGRSLLFVVAAGLLVVFVVIGVVITRDARRTLPESSRTQGLREEGPHRHSRDAKAKARRKGRAQRKARRATRRKAR
jgi:hypothetical protein